MTKSEGMNRRRFLRGATGVAAGAALGFPAIVPSSVLGQYGTVVPSERVVMGFIGVGQQGTANLEVFLSEPDVQVVGVCDAEERSNLYYDGESHGVEPAYQKVSDYYAANQRVFGGGGCEIYDDFRRMLTRDDIDAVAICTPDHWHAVMAVYALRSGKDVYCEKPLAHTVLGGREVVEAARQYGQILQTGSLARSNDDVRFACELVLNGRIGKLQTIRAGIPTDQPYHETARAMAGPQPVMTPPSSLDYEMWLGPAAYAPYTENRCHFWWRFISDYGGGEVAFGGSDVLDIAQLGNGTDETGPKRITARGSRLPDGLFDAFMDYDFEAEYDNGVRLIGSNRGSRGVRFEGGDGWIFVSADGDGLQAEPAAVLKEEIGPNEIRLGRSEGHHRDFLNSIKSGVEPMAPAEVGHRTASLCHLVNIALATGSPLEWNSRMERISNDYDADRMLSRHFRSPWHI